MGMGGKKVVSSESCFLIFDVLGLKASLAVTQDAIEYLTDKIKRFDERIEVACY